MKRLVFEERSMPFRVSVVYHVKWFWLHKKIQIFLPDTSYGEFLLYNGDKPRFYFNIFESTELENGIDARMKHNDVDAQTAILSLLKENGYRNAKTWSEPGWVIIRSASVLKNINILYAIDYREFFIAD